MPSPSWRSEAVYTNLDSVSFPDLAWEYLRRNPVYIQEVRRLQKVRRQVDLDAFAQRWGVRFPGGSEEDRRTTAHLLVRHCKR